LIARFRLLARRIGAKMANRSFKGDLEGARMSKVIEGDLLTAGRDAIKRYAWQEAYELLSAADKQDPLSPEDLENVGEAAWWIGRLDICIEYHERAHAKYLEAGNHRRAAYMATALTRHYTAKGDLSVAMGWFGRAERLLQDMPESPEHGWLSVVRASIADGMRDADTVLAEGIRQLEIGTKFVDRDLQAYGLMNQGRALVTKGEVSRGLSLLDEATVAAVSGDCRPLTTGVIYCCAIGATASLADYRRAGEWTEAARRWCERQSIAGGFPGICRVHRAEIVRLQGGWAEAEQEARKAADELQSYFPQIASEAFYEIGEVRLRMGDLGAANEAFRQAHEMGRDPEPGLALLRLAEGKPDSAAALIKRAFPPPDEGSRLSRAKLLPAQVEIAVNLGDFATAGSATEELESIAEAYGSAALRASAADARGRLLLAEGDAEGAEKHARRAWRLWQEVEAPYEAARARMTMGLAIRAQGDEDSARMELEAAKSALERLGAELDARKAWELLGGDGRAARPATGVRATKVFMFTDIVKSTNLVEVIGDEAWEDVLRWHDETLRSLFASHGGQEINRIGDGFFVAFDNAKGAVECAVAIQRRLAEHRKDHGFAPQVRIGVHATEATRKGLDYQGKGVHAAARIGALAEGGEILVSRETLDVSDCRYPTSDPRQVTLKGISQPIEVSSVEWRS